MQANYIHNPEKGLQWRSRQTLRPWVRFSLRTRVKRAIGFLRALRFPPTAKVDRMGKLSK